AANGLAVGLLGVDLAGNPALDGLVLGALAGAAVAAALLLEERLLLDLLALPVSLVAALRLVAGHLLAGPALLVAGLLGAVRNLDAIGPRPDFLTGHLLVTADLADPLLLTVLALP